MKITRRTFINKSAVGAALILGSGSIFGACMGHGVRRDDFRSGTRPFEPVPALDDDAAAILYYASLAPSGHNVQPWYVRMTGRMEFIVGADPARFLPAVDPENREALLSIGAFLENLSIAAGCLGYNAEIKVIAKSQKDEDLAHVTLKKAKAAQYPLSRIVLRKTVKRGHLPGEIRAADIDFLSEELKGHLFYFPKGTRHAGCIKEGAIEAYRSWVERDAAQKENAEWCRLSNADARKYRDGLTTEGMEIKGIAGAYVRNFVSPADFMKPGMLKQSLKFAADRAGEGGGWIIINGYGDGPAGIIETGRRFERMALTARERLIGLHPMTQLLEEEVGMKSIASNHSAHMKPQFVLRVGYVESYPQPVSLRRPVSWFLKT